MGATFLLRCYNYYMTRREKKTNSDINMRYFTTGAARNDDELKHDYEGFLSPLVLERFAEYMTKHRLQADGKIRSSDNWKKGIPIESYMKSHWRHFFSIWKSYSGLPTEEDIEDSLCADIFNASGHLHEILKKKLKELELDYERNENGWKKLKSL